MSEYQYYEFAAVDQPLSKQQQAELRALSSRATISASGFHNEYHWGDLKGDPLDWMKQYFDAHVYSANWASCRFMLRLPKKAFDKSVVAAFTGDAFSATATAQHWILDWSFDDDSGELGRFYTQEDGPGWLARLLPLRDELLRGDTRPLYLGWLARLCGCELDDEDEEPPLPAGLRQLSQAQAALAEFLELDPDLLAVAAAASADLPASRDIERSAKDWAEQMPVAELRAAMAQLVAGQGRDVERIMRARHMAWQSSQTSMGGSAAPARTVAQIEEGRGAAEQLRLAREREQEAARLARQQAEHAKHLAKVALRADAIWCEIDQTLKDGNGAAYGKAFTAVSELAQALETAGRRDEFRRGLVRLLSTHGGRPAWVARLAKAGLM
ncbi:hypothetical protein LJR289_004617 [Pseudoduganella sp. LjRoot289]|uniref:hypothetical protein n=1 Tax=Pseudoduganella sp. LjRoot289 TaxID=3342314 RepID=UPI003ECFEF18